MNVKKLDILKNIEVVNIDEDGIELKVEFKDPLYVSHEESTDMLFV